MGGFPGRREDWRVRRSRPSAQNRSACAPTIPAQSHTSKAAAIPNTPAGPSAIGEPTPGRPPAPQRGRSAGVDRRRVAGPATEYLLVEPPGQVYGVLATSDLDHVFAGV